FATADERFSGTGTTKVRALFSASAAALAAAFFAWIVTHAFFDPADRFSYSAFFAASTASWSIAAAFSGEVRVFFMWCSFSLFGITEIAEISEGVAGGACSDRKLQIS